MEKKNEEILNTIEKNIENIITENINLKKKLTSQENESYQKTINSLKDKIIYLENQNKTLEEKEKNYKEKFKKLQLLFQDNPEEKLEKSFSSSSAELKNTSKRNPPPDHIEPPSSSSSPSQASDNASQTNSFENQPSPTTSPLDNQTVPSSSPDHPISNAKQNKWDDKKYDNFFNQEKLNDNNMEKNDNPFNTDDKLLNDDEFTSKQWEKD